MMNIKSGKVTITQVASGEEAPTENYDGNATVDVTGLDAGNHVVEVTYNGCDNYNRYTVTDDFNVVKANTTLSVEADESIKVGETRVINITVDNENATGNVTINIDGKNYTAELKDGKANFTTPKLTSGNHTITVVYDGDSNLTERVVP